MNAEDKKKWQDSAEKFFAYDAKPVTMDVVSVFFSSIVWGLSLETSERCYVRWLPSDKRCQYKDWGIDKKGGFVVPRGIVIANTRDVMVDISDGRIVSLLLYSCEEVDGSYFSLVPGSARVPYLVGNSRYYDSADDCGFCAEKVVECPSPIEAVRRYQQAIEDDEDSLLCCVSRLHGGDVIDDEARELLTLPAEKSEEIKF